MGEILIVCQKCGEEEWVEWGTEHTIQSHICKKCNKRWLMYVAKNHERLEREYLDLVKKGKNVPWLAFIGQLPKEKVMFT